MNQCELNGDSFTIGDIRGGAVKLSNSAQRCHQEVLFGISTHNLFKVATHGAEISI